MGSSKPGPLAPESDVLPLSQKITFYKCPVIKSSLIHASNIIKQDLEGTLWEYYLGKAKISSIFGVCMKYLKLFGVPCQTFFFLGGGG